MRTGRRARSRVDRQQELRRPARRRLPLRGPRAQPGRPQGPVAGAARVARRHHAARGRLAQRPDPDEPARAGADQRPDADVPGQVDDKSPQAAITYECRVLFGPENGNWKPCGSPSTRTAARRSTSSTPGLFGITDPLHRGHVRASRSRATDEVGLTGPASTTQTFTVDLTPPGTSIAQRARRPDQHARRRLRRRPRPRPARPSSARSPGDVQGVVFADGPCPGGAAPHFAGLADDVYTLTGRVDRPGAATSIRTARRRTSRSTRPRRRPTLDSGPPARRSRARRVSSSTAPTPARSTASSAASTRRATTTGRPASRPRRYGGLADGDHTLDIRAVDEAGNVDPTPEHVVVDGRPDGAHDRLRRRRPRRTQRRDADVRVRRERERDVRVQGRRRRVRELHQPVHDGTLADGPHTFTSARPTRGQRRGDARATTPGHRHRRPGVSIDSLAARPGPRRRRRVRLRRDRRRAARAGARGRRPSAPYDAGPWTGLRAARS